jgi:hypothetical protein
MSYLKGLPPLSKQNEEDEDTQREMAANLRILTEGIRARQGKVSGFDITLTQDAMPTYLDFEKGIAYSINIPAGTPTVLPGSPVYVVELVNLGPGIIKHSIGLTQMEGGSVTLINGQYKKYEAGRAIYKSLTIRAIGASATLNIAFEV